MTGAFAARAVLAACGFALIAAAPARPRRGGARPVPWEMLLARVAVVVAPVASRSELLGRPRTAAVARRRIALVGSESWVARVAFGVAGLSLRLGGAPPQMRDQLAAAMAALRATTALTALAAALPVAWVAGGLVGAAALLAALASVGVPDAALAAAAHRAERTVDVATPAALELLAACCRGGIALEAGLALTAAQAPPPLRGVLERARRRQRAGESPAAALRVEAEAVGVHEVAAVGRLVERHHQLGLPLEGPLLARAQAARARARVAALARAGRGVPLASLLVATVIAPCCVGVLATWVVLATLGQAGLA